MDRNTVYREKNLFEEYTMSDILNMIHGYKENDLFIGDYFIVNNIIFRFAYFDIDNKYAAIMPDTCICISKMNFTNTSKGKFEKSYINTYVINRIFEEYKQYFPILKIVLPNANNFDLYPLFKLKASNKISKDKRRYWLENTELGRFNSVNSMGKIGTSRPDSMRGIRPFIFIGYCILSVY